jgi:pyruvate,water dikinase
VRATSPAFNAVLSIAGAVVTANGGAMSHAAVLARELGIPAVVGAGAALDIPDGAMIEVDPVAGLVRVLESADAE